MISASSLVTMIGLEPLLMVIVRHILFRDKAKCFQWLLGAMAFIGVAILINGAKNNENIHKISLFGCLLVLSDWIIFTAVLSWTQRSIAKLSSKTIPP